MHPYMLEKIEIHIDKNFIQKNEVILLYRGGTRNNKLLKFCKWCETYYNNEKWCHMVSSVKMFRGD